MTIAAGSAALAADITGMLVIETTAGATHSLTTVANQKVMVWATGDDQTGTGNNEFYLKYNGVTKCTVSSNPTAGGRSSFALMYTETPGAATQNITVTDADGHTLENVKIMVLKILV
jgi:hypothetical protein